jgi:type IV pilus biogenesis protein PilP
MAANPVPAPTSSGATAGPDFVPSPEVLRLIGQKQVELSLLELDIKRAELLKRLRETQSVQATGGPPSIPVATGFVPPPQPAQPAAPSAESANPDKGDAATRGTSPSVKLIHREGRELTAILVMPGGESRTVHRGNTLPGGMVVVAIDPDGVSVRSGDQKPHPLPIWNARGGVL